MAELRIGDIVSFSYKGKRSHDPFPQVLILHNNWNGLVHALNFNYLSDHEINYLKAVMNPTYAKEISKTDVQIRQQLMQVGAASAVSGVRIESPHDFYIRIVKPFIKKYDSYRLFKPEGISGVKVITKREILTGKKIGLFTGYLDKFRNLTGFSGGKK